MNEHDFSDTQRRGLCELSFWDVTDGSLSFWDVTDGSLSFWDVTDGSLSFWDVTDGSLSFWDVTDGSLSFWDVTDGSLSCALDRSISVRLIYGSLFLWQNDKEKRSGPFTSKFLSFLLTIVRLYVITIYDNSDFFPQESQFTFCNYLILIILIFILQFCSCFCL